MTWATRLVASDFVILLLAKVTLVLLVGTLAVVIARRLGAAVRHAIWVTALAGSLLIPALIATAATRACGWPVR
jgi:hypothetical protein